MYTISFILTSIFLKSRASNPMLPEGFLDESGLYYFTNIPLKYLKSFLSHKGHSLSLVVDNTLLANMYTRYQSQNKSAGTILLLYDMLGWDMSILELCIIFFSCLIFVSYIKALMNF